jgi:two-component sensor histidine kinase/CheY-like chemotaxis protein
LSWPILLVDDDPGVLQVSQLVLSRLEVAGRPIETTCCHSADEARIVLATRTFAVAVIDVVMEGEHSGLELVRDIRADTRHDTTEIVVRTGQAGAIPEAQVVQGYEISDYWPKGDLTPQRVRTRITGLIRSHETARRLEARVNERGVLLRELNHRVKNNLQTIVSLLNLHTDTAESVVVRRVLRDAGDRIRALAMVHHQLTGHPDLTRLDFGAYARELTSTIHCALAPDMRVAIEVESAELEIEVAIPCGLVLNELLTNAFKYGAARPGAVAGDVEVQVVVATTESGALRVTVHDAGPGFEVPAPDAPTETLGLQLVRLLMHQVGATLSLESDARGTRAGFTLPGPASSR